MTQDREIPTRTPVTILTGFLGSGKTTVLNALLSAAPPMKVGVIENEFGDIGIDNQLVMGVEERLVELANGCLCCTVRGDIIRILHKWLDDGVVLDRVIVETTGIADPGPIVETFAADVRIRDHFTIDGVITIVDALNVEAQLEEVFEARRQVAYADRLIINKCGELSTDVLARVEQVIETLNPLAPRCLSPDGAINPAFILGAARPDATVTIVPAAHDHRHSDISSVSFDIAGELNAARFYRWMGDLLAFRATRIYRVKGILAIEGQDDRVIVQGVRDQIRFTTGKPWSNALPHSQLVLIGSNVEALNGDSGIMECCTTDSVLRAHRA